MTKAEAKDYIREWCPYGRQEEIIKALEQVPILDKIKRDIFNACSDNYYIPVYKLSCNKIFEIIDKVESEGYDGTTVN